MPHVRLPALAEMMFKFNNGDRVKNRINGFVGIVTCRTEWLNGCRRYALAKEKLDKDGNPENELPTYDEQDLELVKTNPLNLPVPSPEINVTPSRRSLAGGPYPPQRAFQKTRR